MKTSRVFLLSVVAALALLQAGCASLFSSGRNTVKSQWATFDETKAAFDQIDPGQTTKEELVCLGFDPYDNPNVRILTYLDIMNRFLPNDSVRMEDLPSSVRECIHAQEKPARMNSRSPTSGANATATSSSMCSPSTARRARPAGISKRSSY